MNKMQDLFKEVKGKKDVNTDKVSYTLIEARLANPELIPIKDLSTIAKWLKIRYEVEYNRPMIGYNFYNCRLAIQNLGKCYNLNNWEVCKLIDRWFRTYHILGYDKIGTDGTLTLSALKTSWIVEGLYKGIGPKGSSRNSSFKNHSEGRRPTTPNKNQISDKTF